MSQATAALRCNLDVGQAQLSVGLAWWYRQHASEQSPQDRGRYESEEMDARASRRALARSGASAAVWEFRTARRERP